MCYNCVIIFLYRFIGILKKIWFPCLVYNVIFSEYQASQKNSHRVSDECLTAASLVLFLLAADMVKGKKQVMFLGQTSWKSQLHFFVEVWGPERLSKEQQKR